MTQPQEQVIQVGQLQMRFFVDGTQTDGHASIAELVVPAGAKTPPPHAHADLDETIQGIAGTLHYTVDGVTHEVTPGTRVFSPRGTPHGFENRGTTEARVLCVFSPATTFGPQYFRDLAELMVPGQPPDFQKVVSVMARYGLTLVAPPTA
jgi:quercetin dioxygenase-like cupin family protein